MCRDHNRSFKMEIENSLLEFTECNFSYTIFNKFKYIHEISIHILEEVIESKKNLEIIKKYFSENKYTKSVIFYENDILKFKNPIVTTTENGIKLRPDEKNIKVINFDKSYMRKYKIKKLMENV